VTAIEGLRKKKGRRKNISCQENIGGRKIG